MLLTQYNTFHLLEAGCDEAGRGCLAGSVFAAAVIFPPDYHNHLLNDSKKLTAHQRNTLRQEIENDAVAWAVGEVSPQEIDQINILRASILAMHRALKALTQQPDFIIVDGNRFSPYQHAEKVIPHATIVKGDAKYLSIAAASILAKTHRDDHMCQLHNAFPHYGWNSNAGYPTPAHRKALLQHGISPYHRRTYRPVAELLANNLFDETHVPPKNTNNA